MTGNAKAKLRCAVYTRKSTEEGLDQEFNSLDAQREACEAYIASQASLGWRLLPDPYDDGGISGGTMDRPALQRLLQDLKDRRVDVVVVYKIDRLTRSLSDFSRMVEIFEGAGASFVSVTQQFNTTTSMGRLTLNVLLSFAQFEREVAGERIRDKIAASRKKGMWMGGTVPLGYKLGNRKLVVDPQAADAVRWIFRRYLQLKSVRLLREELATNLPDALAGFFGTAGEGTHPSSWSRGKVYYLLTNPTYVGKVRHRKSIYDGEHEAIIDSELFDQVQSSLKAQGPDRRSQTNSAGTHLLTGVLFDESANRLGPVFTTNHGRRYCYYVGPKSAGGSSDWRLPAGQLEAVVTSGLAAWLQDAGGLSKALDMIGLAPDQLYRGIARGRTLAEKLSQTAAGTEHGEITKALLSRVTVGQRQVRLSINVAGLAELLGQEAAANIARPQSTRADLKLAQLEIDVPMSIRRRGVETRIVIEGTGSQSKPDRVLVDTIGRAHLLLRRLTDRSGATLAQLAAESGVHIAELSRLLPLAFLAPKITGAILSGQHPAELTRRQLLRADDLPILWTHQSEVLGV